MRTLRLISILLLALLLTACGWQAATSVEEAGRAPAPAGGPAGAPMPELMATAAPASIDETYGDVASSAAAPPAQPGAQRLVIKTASLTVEVEDVAVAEARISARAAELGGYVVSAQSSGSDTASRVALITFRVPAQRFDEALAGVEGLARKVFSRTISGDDVTEEFVDLESRLRNLEATRDRLLDLMARATRVEDALQVNQALSDVQGQIEQIQGRMKYLQQSAAFSAISVELRPVPPPPAIIEEDAWQPLRVARTALRDLVSFGQELVNLGIVILIWSPVWLPILLLARWGWLRLSGRHRRATT
ncbi:MAG: DUF4349 domain-containing protein [Chloroflexi bacterium]|nr:DUF4349 domain-containing protein [Chloroflexota bacterium]